MEALLAGLALTFIALFIVPLAVLRAGIRRQERAASLTSQPRGFAAAVTRRLLGLHAIKPADQSAAGEAATSAPLITNGQEAR